MSRWLWALLGGVVLVAIAAAFWTASNRTNVSPPVSPEPTAVAPAPVPPAPPAPAPVVHERAPSPASAPPAQEAAPSPAAPAVQQAATPPAPAPPPAPGAPPAPAVVQAAPAPLPAAPNPAPNADSKRRRRPLSRRALAPPRLRPSLPRSLRLLQLRRPPNRHCRRPRPDGRRSKSQAYLRPRTLRSWWGPGPIPRGTAIGCSSGAAAAGPFANRWISSLRPLLSSRRKKSFCLPPHAGLMARLERTARSR